MRVAILMCGAILAACGPVASLSEFSCRTPCQDPANPLVLRLTTHLDDPENDYKDGELVVHLEQTEIARFQIARLHTSGDDPRNIILQFDVPIPFEWITNGKVFTLVVRAENGDIRTSEERLSFLVHL